MSLPSQVKEDNMTTHKKTPEPNEQIAPTIARIFLVAANVEHWTAAETQWLQQHPKYLTFEAELRAAIITFGLDALTQQELVAFSRNSAWASHDNNLDSVVESTQSRPSQSSPD